VELPPQVSLLTYLVVIPYACVVPRRVHGEAVPRAVVKTAVCVAGQFAPYLRVIFGVVAVAFSLAARQGEGRSKGDHCCIGRYSGCAVLYVGRCCADPVPLALCCRKAIGA